MSEKFFKELYDYQIGKRHQLDNRVNILITGMALNGAFLGYLYSIAGSQGLSVVFYWMSILPMAFFAISLYFLAFSYFHEQYITFVEPEEWFDYYQKLKEEHPDTFEALFADYVQKERVNITSVNQKVNFLRGHRLLIASRLLITSMCSGVLLGVWVMINSYF